MRAFIQSLRFAALLHLAFACSVVAQQASPLVFENIEAMRKADVTALPDHQTANVLGYYAANDGGGGEFYWLRADHSPLPATNLGTVFAPLSSLDAGHWVRLVNTHTVNVLWFGVKPLAFDDPDIAIAAPQVAAANLARIRNAIESLPAMPGGASASGPAHHITLHFPSLPFVRRVGSKDVWVTNTQSTCYFIPDTLRVTKNCTISGDGMDRTSIVLAPGVAPSARHETFVVDFEKWGITGTGPSQGETFECHLRDISLVGGTDNPGSSGVRMDGAQMSSIENVAVSDMGLRGVVGSAYFLHNLSIHRITRGPGLEITQNGSDFGFCSASHIFVGFVNAEETVKGFIAGPHKDTSANGIGDGDYWPAVQLSRCEHFTCADLRIERAPIALKIGLCGHVLINHLSAAAPTATKGLSAIKLINPRDGGYVGTVAIHGIDAMHYDFTLWDNANSPSTGTPSDLRYPVLSSFRRDTNDLFSGRLRMQGQGPESPLQVFAHPLSKSSGGWFCEFFNHPMSKAAKPAFRVRNDGLIEAWGGTVPVSTQPLRIVQSPLLRCTLPALGAFASKEQVIAVAGASLDRHDIVSTGFVRRGEENAMPVGVITDASVMDAGHVALRFTNVRPDALAGGEELTFKLIIHSASDSGIKP